MNSGDIRRASIEKVVIKLHRASSKHVLTASEKGHAQMARFEKHDDLFFAAAQMSGSSAAEKVGMRGVVETTMPQSRKTLGRMPQVIA